VGGPRCWAAKNKANTIGVDFIASKYWRLFWQFRVGNLPRLVGAAADARVSLQPDAKKAKLALFILIFFKYIVLCFLAYRPHVKISN
jgi:hypothetical protein